MQTRMASNSHNMFIGGIHNHLGKLGIYAKFLMKVRTGHCIYKREVDMDLIT